MQKKTAPRSPSQGVHERFVPDEVEWSGGSCQEKMANIGQQKPARGSKSFFGLHVHAGYMVPPDTSKGRYDITLRVP